MTDLLEDAHTVLLPAFASLDLESDVIEYLRAGGVSLLIGESREEYVCRSMKPERSSTEKSEMFKSMLVEARKISGSDLIVAVDQELAGIQRLHKLVPPLPSLGEASLMNSNELYEKSVETANAARELGVNLFLSPIADVVSGENPWLRGRTLGENYTDVSRIACAFTRGTQAAGVAATGKHFPGHPITRLDPALEAAIVDADLTALKPTLSVFEDLIDSNIAAIMTGPALVPAIDTHEPSSTSRLTIDLLKIDFGFKGLIISDDLDAPGILRGREMAATAIAALDAGAELLLVSSQCGLKQIANAIANAVLEGTLSEEKLRNAAMKVRNLAKNLNSAMPNFAEEQGV